MRRRLEKQGSQQDTVKAALLAGMRMASRHCHSNRRTPAPSAADCPPRCLARTLTMTSSLWSGRSACARNPGAAP